MLETAIFKQDFLINKKNLLTAFALQLCSLILAAVIRGMRLLEISDIFWDTIPVVIIPMGLLIVLARQSVQQRQRDKTMDILLTSGLPPKTVIRTKALFLILCTFLLFCLSIAFGCLTHVYDLTGLWSRDTYIVLNLGGMCLQLLVGGWCFFISCAGSRRSEWFYWLAGAGLLLLFYAVYLVYYLFPQMAFLQFFTVFSLFRQASYASASLWTLLSSLILAALGLALYWGGAAVFCKNNFRD